MQFHLVSSLDCVVIVINAMKINSVNNAAYFQYELRFCLFKQWLHDDSFSHFAFFSVGFPHSLLFFYYFLRYNHIWHMVYEIQVANTCEWEEYNARNDDLINDRIFYFPLLFCSLEMCIAHFVRYDGGMSAYRSVYQWIMSCKRVF